MTLDISLDEAEILVAVLTYSEGAALVDNPSIVEALKALRPWRSALLRNYVVAKLNEAAVKEP